MGTYRLGLLGLPTFLLLLTGALAAAQSSSEEPACSTVPACIENLMAQARAGRQASEPVRLGLAAFGDSAVEALVPLLSNPDRRVRDSAGLSLTYFRRIDPRHLPALVHAWRGEPTSSYGRGNGWLPRPIAATGTDEARQLLWQDFLRDDRESSNAQVVFALASLGEERIRALVLGRFRDCRESQGGEECQGIYSLLSELEPAFPAWSIAQIVDLASDARSDEARQGAEAQLVRLRHPAALALVQRRLAEFPVERARRSDGRWEANRLIDQVSSYGNAARASGPAIARFLASDFDEDLRADAALAMGQIGDSSAVPALLALEPELHDDWLLAYHVAESLGRLRAAQARGLLETLARDHWHRGVRNTAGRALESIGSGRFARPSVPGDGQPYPPPRGEGGEEYLYFGGLRFAGDDQPRWCDGAEAEESQALAQDPVGTIRWPRLGWAELTPVGLDEARQREIRRQITSDRVRGTVRAILPVRSGDLVGFNAGEFGGGIYLVRENGGLQLLVGEPVFATWRMGGRLYVAAGLAHLVLDQGHLYVIDTAAMTVDRVVRLPASPRRLAVSSHRAVIVRTHAGDLAVTASGAIVDPLSLGDCGGPAAPAARGTIGQQSDQRAYGDRVD